MSKQLIKTIMDQQTSPLVCPSHTTQYIGMLVIGILIGTGVSFAYFAKAPAGSGNTYQAGFDAAKKLVEQSSLGGMIRTPDDVRMLSGNVTKVEGNRITVHTQSMNPFDDATLSDRIITVTKDTKIEKFSQKDPKIMQAEMEAFTKKMQSGKVSTQAPVPPEPFTRTPVLLSNIAVGDVVNISTTENIKNAREFSASEIQVQSRPMVPVVPVEMPVK